MSARIIAALALALGTPTLAQDAADPRIQAVDYQAGRVFAVSAAPGYQVTIALAADEQVESAAVGDSAAWQVTANRAGNHIFVKPLQAGVATNLTVLTNVRLYAFDLQPGGAGAPYTLQFHYPKPVVAVADAPMVGRYKVSGARALQPSRISDDGIHTYIEWPASAELPAVYAINARGQEELVNGLMREGFFVIDSVVDRLVFRIDGDVARARRSMGKKG